MTYPLWRSKTSSPMARRSYRSAIPNTSSKTQDAPMKCPTLSHVSKKARTGGLDWLVFQIETCIIFWGFIHGLANVSLGRPPRKTRPETVVCLDSWGRLHDANCKFPKCSPDQDPVNHARKINFLSLFGNAIIRRLENAQPFRYLCNILKKFQNFEEVSKRLSFFVKMHDKKTFASTPDNARFIVSFVCAECCRASSPAS